jgi:hypothetical protein
VRRETSKTTLFPFLILTQNNFVTLVQRDEFSALCDDADFVGTGPLSIARDTRLPQFLLLDPGFHGCREELTYRDSLGADQKLPFHSKGPGEGFNTCQALFLPTTLHFD